MWKTLCIPFASEQQGRSRESESCNHCGNAGRRAWYAILFRKRCFYIDDMTFEKGLPQFSEEHWGFAYKQMKEYFDDEDPDKALQILGWAFVTGGMPARLTSDMERVHRMNFKEPHSLLLLLDDVEREENFYVYERAVCGKRRLLYFYEQNPKMQEYMVQYKEAKILQE